MDDKAKVCVLGGGSLATPLLIKALGDVKAKRAYEIALFGQNQHELDVVYPIARAYQDQFPNLRISLSATTNAPSALQDADIVINQLRAGSPQDRLFDETFPRKYNIPGEESVGPGGFSNALRAIPLVLEYCRLIEQTAPKALLVNLTNPAGMIQSAVQKNTSLNCISISAATRKTIRTVASLINKAWAEIEICWFGTPGLGWLMNVFDHGHSRMSEILAEAERIFGLGVDPEIITANKAIPSPLLAYHYHPDRILAATEGRTLPAAAAIERDHAIREKMKNWKPGSSLEYMQRLSENIYQDALAPLLVALAEKKELNAVFCIANQGSVPFLPDDAVIESSMMITDGQINKEKPPQDISPEIRLLTIQNHTYERLAVEAILEMDIEKAKRALLANPMISNFNQVKGILAEVWPEKAPATFVSIPMAVNEPDRGELVLPTLFFDEKAIEQIDPLEKRFAVITMDVPWKMAHPRFRRQPVHVTYIEELDWYSLEAMERSLPEIDAVIGLGGGMATDAAKYVAWKRRIPVDAVPTITSVDASVTKSIAARAGGHVTYIGYVVPRNVYIDYPLIMGAPQRLNRSGAGDILCAHTALYDWKLAHDHQDEAYDPNAVEAMLKWLQKIEQHAADVQQVNQAGVKIIMQAFEDISIICRRFGSSRPQEGADHTFAYNAEYQTGKHFLHGELVALGTYVIACLQENDPEYIRSVFEKTGLMWQPNQIGMTHEDFTQTVKTLNWYQSNFGRRYSILDEITVGDQFINMMVNQLDF